MVQCINFGCPAMPNYDSTIQACAANVVKGGFSAIYLINCGVTITNPGSVSELQTLVDNDEAFLIENIKGGWGAPSEITVDPITSCGTPVVVNYDWQATIEDFKVTSDNTAFWDAATRRPFGGVIFVECTTEGLTARHSYVDAEVRIAAFREMPNNNNEAQKFTVTLKWKSLTSPQIFNVAA
jgi:hypothetical protein